MHNLFCIYQGEEGDEMKVFSEGYPVRTGRRLFSYETVKKKLDALGVTYYSKGKTTPKVYVTMKAVYAVTGFAAGLLLSPAAAVIIAAAAFFYPDMRAELVNRKDNIRMLGSIMDVYDVVYLQTNAGEYITRTLIDAYRVAAHPRLKAALITLTGDIIATNDLVASIEAFGKKFDNENIDNLVVMVKQLVRNGASDAMLGDIRQYLTTLMLSYNRHEQERTRRLGDICMFAVFFCMMAVLVYACVRGLLMSAELFNIG